MDCDWSWRAVRIDLTSTVGADSGAIGNDHQEKKEISVYCEYRQNKQFWPLCRGGHFLGVVLYTQTGLGLHTQLTL